MTYTSTVSPVTSNRLAADVLPRGSVLLIDSANLVGCFHREAPTVDAADLLVTVMQSLEAQGYQPIFFMEKRGFGWAYCHATQKVQEFVQFGYKNFTRVNNDSEADKEMLLTLKAVPSCAILTDDRFRNYKARFGEVIDEAHILHFKIENDLAGNVLLSVPRLPRMIFVKRSVLDALQEKGDHEAEEVLAPEMECIVPHVKTPVTKRATLRRQSFYALKQRANNHDPRAFTILATRYATGDGVGQDFERSRKLDRQAQRAQKRSMLVPRRTARQRANSIFLQAV